MSQLSIKVGCSGLKNTDASYWENFQCVEIDEQIAETVTAKTVNKWRSKIPAKTAIVPFGRFIASGGFDTETARSAWSRTCSIHDTLDGHAVLFRTPQSFRPSARNATAIVDFFVEHRGSRNVAWWAEGLWESQAELMAETAEAAGLTCVGDPLGVQELDELPDGPSVFWRLMGRRGLRSGFTDYELDTLIDLAFTRQDVTMVFTSPAMQADAIRFVRTVRRNAGLGQDD